MPLGDREIRCLREAQTLRPPFRSQEKLPSEPPMGDVVEVEEDRRPLFGEPEKGAHRGQPWGKDEVGPASQGSLHGSHLLGSARGGVGMLAEYIEETRAALPPAATDPVRFQPVERRPRTDVNSDVRSPGRPEIVLEFLNNGRLHPHGSEEDEVHLLGCSKDGLHEAPSAFEDAVDVSTRAVRASLG